MSQINKGIFKIYTKTSTSFIKSEYATSERPMNRAGKPIIWKWGAERLTNEGAALELLAKFTTIPVPRVISCGKDERGVMHLEVERKDGITAEAAGKHCRMPSEPSHTTTGSCSECERIASEQVNYFIEKMVMSQLQKLKATETGLDGFVLPPPRIEQYDDRHVWEPKKATSGQEFVFCHGDLSRSNILLDPHTLQVVWVVDWEQAGFYPAELEHPLWRLNYTEYMNTYRDEAGIRNDIILIT